MKKNFFPVFSSFGSRDIVVSNVFFQKISISNFYCSQLWASCDRSLESSWGVDSKYIFFMGQKPLLFDIKSLIILTILGKKCLNHFRMNISKNYFFDLHTPIDSFLSVCQKNPFFLVFSSFGSPDISVSDVFFLKKIYI